jgi:hypothetical protein
VRAFPAILRYSLSIMFPSVATKDPAAVELEIQTAYLGMFPEGKRLFVPQIFGWAIECFTGQYRDYQAVDALYHDFEHTLQGALCLARLLHGRHRAGAVPSLTERLFQLAIVAILLHDTGYLKKREDTEGTGAKYTITHVVRSAEFAAQFLADKRFSPSEILAVQNMIRCTGVSANLAAIPFQNEMEKLAGCALATADLLGQMAAEDYVDKLPILYDEFAEAARYAGDSASFVAGFSSAADLIERTPAFWQGMVQKKLERDFLGLYRFLSDSYPSGRNTYLERIEANMARVRKLRPVS